MTYDQTPRDPDGTDPRRRPSWVLILGTLAAIFFVLGVITALAPNSTRTVSNTPPPATQVR